MILGHSMVKLTISREILYILCLMSKNAVIAMLFPHVCLPEWKQTLRMQCNGLLGGGGVSSLYVAKNAIFIANLSSC